MARRLPPIQWVWTADLRPETCAACWAMHGTVHPLREKFSPAHIGCGCEAIRRSPGDERVLTGEERLEGLSAKKQREVLGDARYEAFARGDLSLKDMVGRTAHGLRPKTLQELGL